MQTNNKKVYKTDWKLFGIGFIVFIIIVALVSTKSDKNITTTSSSSDLKSGQNISLTADLPACTSKENLNNLNNYMMQKNEDAKNKMLSSGEVIVISSAEKIDIVDLGALTTKINYNENEYYVNTDFIKQ
ncbi:hypothetical protein [Clostridium tagluense]|uniref:hypothetical protein n=1 Tax=Clostridium tagluense TaxID=360422 RepID=UPI001C6F30CB|nr:hypothetical protein [Clostridium tagluense]MBW9154891.1 hypothetical protein [Clostridium tagluense]WLC64346.1 hypothetical protein KTC93_15910 [Clostridium tagluense]